jgi:hypothetical protein
VTKLFNDLRTWNDILNKDNLKEWRRKIKKWEWWRTRGKGGKIEERGNWRAEILKHWVKLNEKDGKMRGKGWKLEERQH